ncbi:hypothetical protein [Stakelama saccharophila]|uniref:Uncharacterized protein n=1 Tax=Stakelama saccharophila TaxID=3075605 RepID=A0ABZ0BE91_9SPHN|nr:hypothetical protein [Stakelama sp. W311]WNO54684.1 hypothetical protein RPR59_05385 [Stakelama sp. W311]
MAKQRTGRHVRWHVWRVTGWGTACLLLALPLVAMRFTDEVAWTAGDFVFAACLFGGIGGAFELAVRRSANPWYRTGAAMALATILLIIWINAAVGIIGDEENPLDLLYGCVILTIVAGAAGAGLHPAGMARALAAAAVAQAAIGAIATVAGRSEPPGPLGLMLLNGFFLALLLCSALAFRSAARQDMIANR